MYYEVMLKHLHIGQNFPRQLLYDFVKTSIFLELRGHKISTENKTVGFPEGMKEGSKGIPILFPHSWGLGGSCTVLTWTAPILASLVSSPFPAPWTLNRCTISPQVLHCTLHRFSVTTIDPVHCSYHRVLHNCYIAPCTGFLLPWSWFLVPNVYKLGDVFDSDGGGGEVMMLMMCGAGGDNRRQWKAPQEASTRTWQSSAWAQFYC